MNYFLFLSSCDTCKRIIKTLNLPDDVVMIDIKKSPISTAQIEEIYNATGSYESLINKRAQLLKQRNIDTKNLTEETAKQLLTDHYTFLKRPVLVYNGKVFIGNSKKEVEMAKSWLDEQ